MKTFQNELLTSVKESIDVPFKITDNFPGFMTYHIDFKLVRDQLVYGGNLTYRTTGGRISYADYSGMQNVDNNLEAFELKGLIGKSVLKSNKLTIHLNGNLGLASTLHELSSNFQVTGENEIVEKLNFSSLNLIIGLASQLGYSFNNWIFLTLNLGYDIHFPGKLKFRENKNAYLLNDSGDPVKVDWSGFRSGVGIGFNL